MATEADRNHERSLIEMRDVVKDYPTGAGLYRALNGISLQVHPGELLSVVGPSGSGKSTLLNMITGVDHPTSGEVLVAGTPVHRLGESAASRWRCKAVGMIFQFFQLLPTLSILENVMLPMEFCKVGRRATRRDRAMQLLERVDIATQAHKLPSQLSGGQQQRAAIARALVNDPPLIVGDEPTGNLDSAAADAVFHLFQDLAVAGKTLILVTHDLALSARTSRVLHMLDGQLHRDAAPGL